MPEGPQALVVFFHGLGEHIGSYEPFAAALNAAGIAVWAHDHAGHGRSEGERVLVTRIDDLLEDAERLVALARAAHPALPFVLAGHSLGSTVAALLTAERLWPAGVRPASLVLAGSGLVQVSDVDNALAALLASGIDPWDLRKDPGELTRNEAYAQQVRDDPLTWQGGLRVETLTALGEAGVRLGDAVESRALPLPVLLLHGEADDLAPAAGARRAAELLPDARAVIFPHDRHNILNEIDRDEVYRVLTDFVARTTAHAGSR
ncbi:alpha/beta fold hydrolase [Amycolatopsis anabasis]|uniref:alpha/beta fold hydrolase n=1 Tax=Amycolatopsis anabasis TaxID=1840409 RepID=UPI001FEAC613|nr:alpha/beta fold hydrolase [Amycolatopsis anabasis]